MRYTCEFADQADLDDETINPTDEPSEAVDLAQWLGLFYQLTESAANEENRQVARHRGYRASLCLAEALKFYGDNEIPPPESFFGETSRQAFHEHPENFARQRLRDMQSLLPSLQVMRQKVNQDRRRSRPAPWWRFWRR